MNPTLSAHTSDASEILDLEFGDDPTYGELRAQERVKSQAAQVIYDARLVAGLTQTELARLAGTTQSVISRLEDGDYDKHSLALLERIAAALHRRGEVRFVPALPADTPALAA
jgi:ribosome-binding protein aMBF1 (putative translation factor)